MLHRCIVAALLAALLAAGGLAEEYIEEGFPDTESFFEEDSFFEEEDFFTEEFFAEEAFFEEEFFSEEAPEDAALTEENGIASEEQAAPAEEEAAELEDRSVVALPGEETAFSMALWQGVPLNFRVSPDKKSVNKVTLYWDLPTGLTKLPKGVKYYIYEVDPETGAAWQVGCTTARKLTLKKLIEGEHTWFIRTERNTVKTAVERYGLSSDTLTWTVSGSALWMEKPTLKAVQRSTESNQLTFTVTEPAEEYVIEMKSGKSWMEIGRVEADGTKAYVFEHEGITAGLKYSYRVYARKEGVAGKVSATKTVKTTALWQTNPVVTLSQANGTDICIRFSVTEPAENYIIERKLGKSWIQVGSVEGTDARQYEMTDEALDAGTKYTYRVYALKDGMAGKISASKSLKVIEPWQAAPRITEARQTGDLEVTLRWTVSAPALNYRIYIGGSAAKASAVLEQDGQHAIVKVSKAEKYKFSVLPVSINAKGKTVSGQKSAAVAVTVAAPEKLGAQNIAPSWEETTLTVSWDSISTAAESFDVLCWRKGQNENAAEIRHVEGGHIGAYSCTFEGLQEDVWHYCVRTNINNGTSENGRIVSGIFAYDLAAAPPTFTCGPLRVLGNQFTVSWQPVHAASAYRLMMDGQVIGETADESFTVTEAAMGRHVLTVCGVDAQGQEKSYWSNELEVWCCREIEAAASMDQEQYYQSNTASITVSATGGWGDYAYTYVLQTPDGETATETSTEPLFSCMLREAGKYVLNVHVSDSVDTEGTDLEPLILNVLKIVKQDGITYLLEEDGNGVFTAKVAGWEGDSSEVTIPEEVEGFTVTAIAATAFSGFSELNRITIPSTVTELEEGWADGCGEALLVLCEPGSPALDAARLLGLDYESDTVKRALVFYQDYKENAYLPELYAPANDAAAMKAMLQNWGYQVSVEGNKSASEMKSLIGSMDSKADDTDITFIAYSGHGLTDGSLPAANYAMDSESSETGILTAEEFAAAVRAIPGRKIVFVDACYSGKLIEENADNQQSGNDSSSGGSRDASGAHSVEIVEMLDSDAGLGSRGGAEEDFAEAFTSNLLGAFGSKTSRFGLLRARGAFTNMTDTWVMAAAQGRQKSWEAALTVRLETVVYKKNMGLFSYYFCKGLGWNGVADRQTNAEADGNADGAVSISEAFRYAAEQTQVMAEKYNKIQTAELSDESYSFAPFR